MRYELVNGQDGISNNQTSSDLEHGARDNYYNRAHNHVCFHDTQYIQPRYVYWDIPLSH